METTGSTHIAIRLSTRDDRAALVRLAALDSAPVPVGRVLVAATGAQIVAAHPLGGGRPIADPFSSTADARELLELRAGQLQSASHRQHRYLPGRIARRRRPVGSAAAVPAAR
jgi:hypothetical protein